MMVAFLTSSLNASSLLANNLHADSSTPESFCFVSFGCWGGLNKVTQKRVAEVMGRAVEKESLPTLFVIAAGDNFYKKGVTSIHDPRFLTTFDDVYNHQSLMQLPFLVALGNHDYRGDFIAQVNYTTYQLKHVPRATGRWYLPEAYYVKQVHANLVVFVLDTPLLERCANNGNDSPRCWDHGAQKRYFEEQFEKFRHVKWKVVVGHYPMHANGPHVNFPWLIQWLQPLLEKYCVSLYINADNHYLQVSSVNGVYYVNSGGGAGFGVRHQPANRNYKTSPFSQFVAFEDGIFTHCIHEGNHSMVTSAINHEGLVRQQFVSDRSLSESGQCGGGVGAVAGGENARPIVADHGDRAAAAHDGEVKYIEQIPVGSFQPTAPRVEVSIILMGLGVVFIILALTRGGNGLFAGRNIKRP
ncbi:tartrate-resistant acid phosphatase type 5, putative [Bodo saltans]|uniref:Tartrate-resistant acid phosphatase type 5, putative n=1 Tax=Bodo saltans TaxID=75058 RepID=A0A0S4KP92_BODSA|nr:tartrate-resistant acid phosphatase type 5, putative [Bodo saltans]|eukprot:CUI15445.1 tartrate-resistant acid phosphatase type 5, putative [Bodo saltans]